MFRRVIAIAATLAGFGVLALLGFVLFRQSPPAGDAPPRQSTQGSGPAAPAAESPAAPAAPATLPAAYRANMIVDFPDPDVSFMSINVDLDAAAPADALATIADAAHVPVDGPRSMPPNRTGPPPEVSLHLKDQPYIEALLQLEAQASLIVSYDEIRGYHAQYSMGRGLPGIWSVSGPFAFVLTNMEHIANVTATGSPSNGGETVLMQFDSLQEPGLKVLRYPMELKVIEATDNHGHSLVSDGAPTWSADGNATKFPPRATLAYPADDPGRRIKHFRASAKYMVQLKGETITIDDPFHAPATTSTVAGVRAEFEPMKWTPAPPNGSGAFAMKATYHKTDAFKGDWPTLALGLVGMKPTAALPGSTNPIVNANGSVSGDVATVNYTITLPPSFKGTPAVITLVTEPPQFDTLTIEIPSGVKQITVPVELNDIPLP